MKTATIGEGESLLDRIRSRPVPEADDGPLAEFYALVDAMADANEAGRPGWATHDEVTEYASVCRWAIRRHEYAFVISQVADLDEGRRTLDVGAGVVPFANWLSKRGHDAVALDADRPCVNALRAGDANEFYGSHVDYVAARAEDLPFPDASFDLATCVSVLEHLPSGNDRIAVQEIARVLRPGGRLVLTVDVEPQGPQDHGLPPFVRPIDRGFYGEPWRALLKELDAWFEIEPTAEQLVEEVGGLTPHEVEAFWERNAAPDTRDGAARTYVAAGILAVRRDGDAPAPRSPEADLLLLEGQEALFAHGRYHADHARRRLRVIEEMEEALKARTREVRRLEAEVEKQREDLTWRRDALQDARERAAPFAATEEHRALLQDEVDSLREDFHNRLVEAAEEQTARDEEVASLQRRVEALQTGLDDACAERARYERIATERLEVIENLDRHVRWYRMIDPLRLVPRLRPRLFEFQQHEPRPLPRPGKAPPVPEPAPRISIVTPSYNQRDFIERTARSVLDEGYPNLQYFIQDGASDDGTVAVLEKLGDAVDWVSEPDGGQAEAINKALARTDGEIMAYLNSDDLLLSGTLARVADFFARNPDVDVVYGNRAIVDEHDDLVGEWILPKHDPETLKWADYVPQETLFWRRRIWDKVGGSLDESFRFALDWDLLLRFQEAGAKMVRLPYRMGAFRVHAEQKTSSRMEEDGIGEMQRLRKRSLGFEPTPAQVRNAVRGYMLRHVFARVWWRLWGKRR